MNMMTTSFCTSTLADVLNWAKQAGESQDAIYELLKVPARLGLPDDDLHLVSADRGHFERIVAASPYGAVSRRSGNIPAARRRANARLRALLARFHAAVTPQAITLPPAQTARDAWDALIDWIKEREGFVDRGALWTQGTHRGLAMLRARSPVGPSSLLQVMIADLVPALNADQRDTLCRNVRLINRLRACAGERPEIAHLVPAETFAVPQGSSRARPIAWESLPDPFRVSFDQVARRTLASPDDLVADAEARIAAGEDPATVFAGLEGPGRLRRRLPENHVTALDGYRWAVTWLVRAAEDRGSPRASLCDLRDVMTYPLIKSATDDQVARSRAAPDLKDPVTSDTLKGRLTNLRTLALHGLRDDALVRLIDGQTRLSVTLPRSKRRATDFDEDLADADRIAELLHGNPHIAVRLVNAPQRLATIADELLAAARATGRVAEEEEALRTCGSAAAWAVEMTRPPRTSNLRNLRHRARPDLHANISWPNRQRSFAKLHFRAGEIKNVMAMSARIVGADARILCTWLDVHRPRLMEIRGLSADNCYVFPGKALPDPLPGLILPRGAMAPSSFDGLWRIGAEHLGVVISVHRIRHVVATLILAMRPGNYGLVATVLGSTEDVVRRHYGRDNAEAAAAQVREELLRRHPDLMKLTTRRYQE